uniref:hypothetical protein n=1 Tax=Ochrobactrum sp. LM19 TaxID=1449781 RepID=UPI0015E7E5C1|nr:hypothetical protein [Ochrobactrum sp. LM19]
MKKIFPIACVFVSLVSSASVAGEPLTIIDRDGSVLAQYSATDIGKAFPVTELITTTPWTNDDKIKYSGVLVEDILKANKIEKSSVYKFIATDDYVSDISGEDIEAFKPIVATHIGCTESDFAKSICKEDQKYRQLTDADRGPFYVVWPQEKLPTTPEEANNHRWVWFLTGLQPKAQN